MKTNESNKQKQSPQWLYPSILFIIAVAVITYMFQYQNGNYYKYQLNRPWQYSELKAQFDFNINKSQSVIDKEREKIIKTAPYYYNFDINKEKEAKKIINQMSQSSEVKDILNRKIEKIYEKCIISDENYNTLKNEGISTIRVRVYDSSSNQEKASYKPRTIDELITLEEARQELIRSITPAGINIELPFLDSLNNIISTNLHFDEDFTQQKREELLANIDSVKLVVKKGDILVERGEIITVETIEKLQAYEKSGASFFVNDKPTIISSIVGQVMLFGGLIGFLYMFLFFFRNRIWNNKRALTLIMLLLTVVTSIALLLSNYGNHLIYMTPFVIIPIITVTFFDARTALYVHIITVMICAFAVMEPLFFIYSQTLAGMATINSLKDMSKRSQLFRCTAITFAIYIFSFISYTLVTEGDITKITIPMIASLLVSCMILLFSYLLIYIFERTFGFLSSVTLVELSDINSPLLLRLSEEAPGTFQHSMQVSNLAAAAAIKVGANAQLVRTGALYHDIGKLANPVFFTENQAGANPHDNKNAIESAKIIISHVKDGMDMAKKYSLPPQVQEFIATHHGHGMVKYFYTTYCNEHPDEEVDKSLFTYPGHNPQNKETGILMMADSVEAASRSLKEYNETSIRRLVNGIIDSQMTEGLLRNTPLSFQDVEIIKDVFVEKLITINHSRVAYPKLNKKPEPPKAEVVDEAKPAPKAEVAQVAEVKQESVPAQEAKATVQDGELPAQEANTVTDNKNEQ